MAEITKEIQLNPQTVLVQLGRLACHYPNSGHTEDSLKVVAEDWYDEFKGISDRHFINIIKQVRRSARFFPVVADLCTAKEETSEVDKITKW